MGGICGYFNLSEPGAVKLEQLLSAMAHRGPDGTAHREAGALGGLGCCRLSPAYKVAYEGELIGSSPDGNIALAADTDIINLEELSVALPAAADPVLQSPAVLLCRLYQHYGLDFLHKIRGVFAIAIIDQNQDSLYLIRDRLGVKPLFYSKTGKGVVFASEIKALLATGRVNRQVNHLALHDYLTYQYVPYPHTAFQGVGKVPPANIYQFKGTSVAAKKWHTLAFQPKTGLSYAECKKQLRTLVEDASKRMLRDVRAGKRRLSARRLGAVIEALGEMLNDYRCRFTLIRERSPTYDTVTMMSKPAMGWPSSVTPRR